MTNTIMNHKYTDEFPKLQIVQNNASFKTAVHNSCTLFLKDDIDKFEYANDVLTGLWDGVKFEDWFGRCYYYEIPARDTKSGHKHIVSI